MTDLDDSSLVLSRVPGYRHVWRCKTCQHYGGLDDLSSEFDNIALAHARLSPDCPARIWGIEISGLDKLGLGEFYDRNPNSWEPYAKVYKYILNWRGRRRSVDRAATGEFSSNVSIHVPDADSLSPTAHKIELTNTSTPADNTGVTFRYQCTQCLTQFAAGSGEQVLSCPNCGSTELHFWRPDAA